MAKVGKQFSKDKKTGKVTYRKDKKKETTFDPITLSKKGEKVKGGQKTTKKIVNGKTVTTLPTQNLKKKQSVGSKALDVISAPLSQPKTTFTKGIGAGAEAVKQRREDIEAGEKGGLGVIGTTLASTAVAGAAALGGGALAAGRAAAIPAIEVSAATMQTVRNNLALSKLTGVATTTVAKAAPKVTAGIGAGARYASNSKTVGLTKSLLGGAGMSLSSVGIGITLLGSYPFAAFAKEETLQSISFAMNAALSAGKLEEAQGLLNASEEMVNAVPTLVDKIPIANVIKEFKLYAEQQKKNNVVWAEIIAQKQSEVGQESDFARERRESDEASIERKREFADEESKKYEDIEAQRKADKLEEAQIMQQVYRLRREGKFDEADQMEIEFLSREKTLNSGCS